MNKPTNEKKNLPREHEFDGILEYDNDLPRWWVGLFLISIAFAVLYMAWFHFPGSSNTTLVDELKVATMAYDEERARSASKESSSRTPEGGSFSYQAVISDSAMLARGQETYLALCQACHGAQGQGLVGPNLTDDFWLHGSSFAQVENSIARGIVDKGMPAWADTLGQDKVRAVVLYLHSIQRSNPANPKAPQGEAGTLQ